MAIGCFLIYILQATFYMVCRGWRTPYPQKRQQTLGATLTTLWKTCLRLDNRGFQAVCRRKTVIWLFFNQTRHKPGLYGLQRTANILSTEAPTEIGGKYWRARKVILGKKLEKTAS